MKSKSISGLFSAFVGISLFVAGCDAPTTETVEKIRPRTVITTDGEVDDYDSFIRALLYANDMDIEAIVYSSSCFHWAGDGKGTLLLPVNRFEGKAPKIASANPTPKESYRWIGTTWIDSLINKYEACYPNLVLHDKDYPTPGYLRSIVKMGNIKVEGDMEAPTEGSEYIEKIILDNEPGQVYMQIWGGTNTVARSLLSIEERYRNTPEWDSIYKKVSEKVVLNIILDQDGTYQGYVAKNWPDIKVIYNRDQFFGLAYLWRMQVPRDQQKYLDGDWFRENINNNHGPLAASYLGMGDGHDLGDPEAHFGKPEMAEQMKRPVHDFISEGDSPSFLALLDFGLRSLEHPEWGGLGGRYVNSPEQPQVYKDPQPAGGFRFRTPNEAKEETEIKEELNREKGDYNPHKGEVDMFYPQTRWIKTLQNDFAARADWCISDYENANHRPSICVKEGIDLEVSASSVITLHAIGNDPDGNAINYHWWQYREAGTSDSQVGITGGEEAQITVPADAKPGTTIHIILEATDNGTPELVSYQRIILTVK